MTLRRVLPRALASLGAVVLVASVPAWSLANVSSDPGGDAPDEAFEPWLEPLVDSTEPAVDDLADAETPEAESGASSGAWHASDGADFDGTSGWVDFNGGRFWIGPPGSHSEVVATVTAHRAALGLPAFVPIENLGGWSCMMVAHGSAVAAGEPTTATLGQLLIGRSPAAVGYRPTAGWAVSATVVVDELILGGGGVYPNRATQIGILHCSPPPPPPGGPTPPPVDLSPPPAEPSPSPTEPPPADPAPTETPTP